MALFTGLVLLSRACCPASGPQERSWSTWTPTPPSQPWSQRLAVEWTTRATTVWGVHAAWRSPTWTPLWPWWELNPHTDHHNLLYYRASCLTGLVCIVKMNFFFLKWHVLKCCSNVNFVYSGADFANQNSIFSFKGFFCKSEDDFDSWCNLIQQVRVIHSNHTSMQMEVILLWLRPMSFLRRSRWRGTWGCLSWWRITRPIGPPSFLPPNQRFRPQGPVWAMPPDRPIVLHQ